MTQGSQHANFSHGQDVLTLLNRDLANEMNTSLMYLADSLLARGTDSLSVREIAGKFADQDFNHVQRIAARIVELNGTPQLLPMQVSNNASIDAKLPEDGSVKVILHDALQNELQSVIEYRGQIQNLAFTDSTTRLLLEEILADKEHQVEEIRNLLGI